MNRIFGIEFGIFFLFSFFFFSHSFFVELIVVEEDPVADMEVDEEDTTWMEPDEGDEIVKELDVSVSTTLSSQLHLFQFPLRPKKTPFENNHALVGIKTRYKPKVRGFLIHFCSFLFIFVHFFLFFFFFSFPQNLASFSSFFLQKSPRSLKCTSRWRPQDKTMTGPRELITGPLPRMQETRLGF